jgi:hypothetical protein
LSILHHCINLPRQRSLRRFDVLLSGSLVGLRDRDGLEKVVVGFGVGKLLERLDLQASIFVGGDSYNENHLANHLHPDRCVRPVGTLWFNYVKTTRCRSGGLEHEREGQLFPVFPI